MNKQKFKHTHLAWFEKGAVKLENSEGGVRGKHCGEGDDACDVLICVSDVQRLQRVVDLQEVGE